MLARARIAAIDFMVASIDVLLQGSNHNIQGKAEESSWVRRVPEPPPTNLVTSTSSISNPNLSGWDLLFGL